jgi:hypothetical protein
MREISIAPEPRKEVYFNLSGSTMKKTRIRQIK